MVAFVLVVAGVAVVAVLAPGLVGSLLVGSTFVTRLRLEVGGAGLLLEHLVVAVLIAALLSSGRLPHLREAARDRTSLLLGAFVVWSALVSLLRSPQPAESLMIVGWLGLDWLVLVALVASTTGPDRLVRQGVAWAGLAAVAGLAMWSAAYLWGSSAGVDQEALTRAPAAYGLSHEPNIFASTLAVWAFLALTVEGAGRVRWRRLAFALCTSAMAASLTRAAFVGLVVGMLVWALSSYQARRKVIRWWGGAVVAAFALVVLVPGAGHPVAAKASALLDLDSETAQVRLEQWDTAVDDLDHLGWAMGLGTNSYSQRYLEPTRPSESVPAYLGNLPLQLVYDTGIVGVTLVGATVMSALSPRRIRDPRALGLGALYLVCASATSPFWFGTTWLLLAIAVKDRWTDAEGGRSAGRLRTTEAITGAGP